MAINCKIFYLSGCTEGKWLNPSIYFDLINSYRSLIFTIWISSLTSSLCSSQVSWCKFEVVVDCPKDIGVSTSSKLTVEIPPVTVAAINLKTIINEKHNVNEIISASVIFCHKAKVCYKVLVAQLNLLWLLTCYCL